MKKQLIAQLVQLHKSTLNPASKWFKTDLEDYTNRVPAMTEKELKARLNNSLTAALNDKRSNISRTVKSEVKKMDKAGLYSVRNMAAKNCLD